MDWSHIISVWKTVLTFFRKWRCCIYMLPEKKVRQFDFQRQGVFFSPQYPDRLGGSSSLLSSECWGLSLGGGSVVSWRWPLVFMGCWNWDWVEVYLHSPYVEICYA